MNGQKDNQIVRIDSNRGLDIREGYETSRAIDRTGYRDASSGSDMDMKSMFMVVVRRKTIIFFTTLLLALATFLYTASLAPVYRATTSVKLEMQSVQKDKMVDVNFQSTQYDVLKSRELAKRVIDKLKLDKDTITGAGVETIYSKYLAKIKRFLGSSSTNSDSDKEEKKEVADEGTNRGSKVISQPLELLFLRKLSLSPSKESNILKIHYDSYDAELAAVSVNTLVDEFIQMNRQGHSDSNAEDKEYFAKQLAAAKIKLEGAEQKFIQYTKEKGVTQGSLVKNSLQITERQYAKAQQALIVAENAYKNSRISASAGGASNNTIRVLKNQRNRLQARYSKQLETYKPAFPAMAELREEIADIDREIEGEQKAINARTQNTLNIRKNALKTKYLTAKQRVAVLAAQLERKKNALLTEDEHKMTYLAMQKEVESARKDYDKLSQRTKEIDIAEGVFSDNLTVMDPAFVPYKKTSPNMANNMALGTFLGLIFGLGVAFMRDRFDVRIRSVSDLEDLVDLPVLGTFPFVKGKNKKKNRDSEGAILLTANHQSAEYEAVRSLVTNLRYTDAKGLAAVIHVTSSSPAEGKSNIAINIASILAENKLKVLLIDADLRKPRIDSYLGVRAGQGLAEYLLDRCEIDDVIIESPQENLSLITAGMPSPSPAKLLAEDTLMELLDYARDKYDHVIIDSPPVLGLADALILSNRADITLFVVASHETKSPNLLDALKRLRLGYGNVVGFVLTKAKASKSDLYNHESYYGYQRNDVVATGSGKPKW